MVTHLDNAVFEVAKHAVHFPLRGAFSNDGNCLVVTRGPKAASTSGQAEE
jgi:hypothetical protein